MPFQAATDPTTAFGSRVFAPAKASEIRTVCVYRYCKRRRGEST